MTLQNFSLFNEGAVAEIDRFLEDIFPAALAYAADSSWNRDKPGKRDDAPVSPVIDVIERDDEVVVQAEMPGVAKEAADVTFAGGVLTLKGAISAPGPEGTGRRIHAERCARPYERSLRIPVKVDAGRISAALKDGLLTVTLRKAEELKPKKIQVEMA
ncbi:MAG: Hsp20/alpha crystallin family protein [Deltaproteobacteria bacterium]|nr:Hsp20/alpha crystallin family protein [Deltaproteobacteria bacterium]